MIRYTILFDNARTGVAELDRFVVLASLPRERGERSGEG